MNENELIEKRKFAISVTHTQLTQGVQTTFLRHSTTVLTSK